jgi:hypothetical protein
MEQREERLSLLRLSRVVTEEDEVKEEERSSTRRLRLSERRDTSLLDGSTER